MFVDLNGDGLADILAAVPGGQPMAFLNSGPPSFAFKPADITGGKKDISISLRQVHLADLTGDGLPDLWYSGAGGVFLKNESGSFRMISKAVPYFGASSGEAPVTALADFDCDGDLDLYVPPHGKSAGGTVLLNDGLGGFKKAKATGELSRFRETSTCAAAGDLTGNGQPDLVVGLASGGIRVFLNVGSATFMDGTDVCQTPGSDTRAVAGIVLADFNGDSAPDICASLSDGVLLLANRSLGAARGDFLTVRPRGKKGTAGALVRLQNAGGSQVIQACQMGSSPLCPPECILGVRDLDEATIEVRFTDGQARSLGWNKSGSPHVLVIERSD
jgi:hypothetical protein